MLQDMTNTHAEHCPPELLTISDARGHQYQLHLFDDDMGWTMKVLDRGALAAHLNCIKQGADLFLADIRVQARAMHPIRGLGLVKCWLGLGAHGRVENYRRLGLGSALLAFVLQRARGCGFRRVTGNLFPKDLTENPMLPIWYQSRGFRVTMEPSQSAGELEFVLT